MKMQLLTFGCWLLSLIAVPVYGQTGSAQLFEDSLEILDDDPIVEMLDSMWQMKLFDQSTFRTEREVLNLYGFGKDSVPDYPDSVYAMRFEVMNSQSPFAFRYNESVKSLTNLYIKRRKKYSSRLLGLSETYYPLFEQMLDKYEMPLELKHLAVIESGLNASARSHAGAVGLWQFMLPTGKWMGLDITSYYDERNDPIKSTDAACRYLKYLYSLYEDWDLALAAYNAGPGNVNKAIRRAGGGKLTYWEVRPYLPKETQSYVPAFYAVNYMMNYSTEHNIFPVYPRIRYIEYDTIHVKQQVTFEQINTVLCLDMEVLEYLNPIYKTHLIPRPTAGSDRVLCLPREQIGDFIMNEEYIYNCKKDETPELVAVVEKQKVVHIVKSGEYLAKIARDYGVSSGQISTWNSLRSSQVVPGQKLTLYLDKAMEDPDPEKPQTETKAAAHNADVYHVVQKGDTLWRIADKYDGVSVDQIRKLNADLDEKNLHSGQRIKVKQKG